MRRVAALLAGLAAGPALAAGGAHLVDDAGVVAPGSCELEAFGNWTGGHAWRAVVSPTCGVALLGGFEIGVIAGFQSAGSTAIPGGSLKKTLGRIGPLRAAAEISVGFDPEGNRGDYVSTNLPASLDLADWLELHLNAGVDFEPGSRPIPTFGIGALVEPAPGWQFVAEVAGRRGRATRPQAGVRHTAGALTFDLLYSEAIDEASPGGWLTLGVTWAFHL
ncbi:hypothetical protein IP88_04255 [alpha proteobacterium AAP81b]|nr:hypothetical protein IP88_04255 [alpha proteobacterium AAP81b]